MDVYCLGCSSTGELRLSFDFDIQSLDLGRIYEAAVDVLHGLKPKPVFNKAIITAEVVEPYDLRSNLRVTAHTGLSVRWPGLVMPTSKKPTLGRFTLKDKEIPLFNVSCYWSTDAMKSLKKNVFGISSWERSSSLPGGPSDSSCLAGLGIMAGDLVPRRPTTAQYSPSGHRLYQLGLGV